VAAKSLVPNWFDAKTQLPKLLRFALVLIWQILAPNQSETPSENEM
jgi:hypothetical protein